MAGLFRSRRSLREGARAAPAAEILRDRMSVPTAEAVSTFQLHRRSQTRSRDLMSVIGDIDACVDRGSQAEIMRWVQAEYEGRQGGTLVGLFQQCYLGAPYVDHKLDLFGDIVHHYERGEVVELPYGQARGLVSSGAYAFVEIYSDGAMVPVRPDGTALPL